MGSKKIPSLFIAGYHSIGAFSRLSRLSRSLRNRNIFENGKECAKNHGGLFGGAWEAKTDFCGLG
jgi:hypothetical protein